MIIHLLIALAFLLWAPRPINDTEVVFYEESPAISVREGPWAAEIERLEHLYQDEDYATLEAELERVTPLMLERYGEASPAYAEVHMLRALSLYQTEQEEDSLPYFALALQFYRAALGDEHVDVALASNSFADALMETRGDNAAGDAVPHYRRAFTIYSAALEPDADEVHNSTLWLVRTLILLSRVGPSGTALAEANQLAQDALSTPGLAERPGQYIDRLLLHGEVLAAMGDYEAAEDRFLEGVVYFESLPHSERPAGWLWIFDPYLEFLEERGRRTDQQELRMRLFGRNNAEGMLED